MLIEKIKNKESGICLFGITPPKSGNTHEKIVEISQRHIKRIKSLDIDGLILYDLQEEVARTSEERPFPFIETTEPLKYSKEYLQELSLPQIVYRCAGKYTNDNFKDWLNEIDNNKYLSIFVGQSAPNETVKTSLKDAYAFKKEIQPDLLTGGVTIPERHEELGNEHLKINFKVENGCSFFVSQAVYNSQASKNFLSDYYYYCKENNKEMVPIIFTISPCGSVKTLEFMNWLGIHFPKWLKNDLLHSDNILEKSINTCERTCDELIDFAVEKNIPIGFNIESVSIRKTEIEAAINLCKTVRNLLNTKII